MSIAGRVAGEYAGGSAPSGKISSYKHDTNLEIAPPGDKSGHFSRLVTTEE